MPCHRPWLVGCGAEENVEQWYDMFNATISQQGGVGMLIENVSGAAGWQGDGRASAAP